MHKHSPVAFLVGLLACAEPDTDDDTGPGPGGSTDGGTTDGGATSDWGSGTPDGGTSAVELCREVETPFDASTAPVSEIAMALWRNDIVAGYGGVDWTTSLDGTAESEVWVGTSSWPVDLVVVEWVGDGSEEAIYPCREGPAVRAWLDIYVTVVPGEAQGTLSGGIDTNGVDYWFSRMRTTSPRLSEDWQTLVDGAEDEAGHPDATTFMEIVNPPDAGASLIIGSETTTGSKAWWSGPLNQGSGLIPAD